jgi:transposase
MKSKKAKARRQKANTESPKVMKLINEHAAGIDVGSTEHYVSVPEDAVSDSESAVRAFGAWTRELDQLVEWLQACKVTTVAMESTGMYWVALAQKLEEAGIDYVLVNARHLRCVPGRKTDVKDCQWLRQLHTYGLLNGSFRPQPQICVLRALMRHRENLTQSAGAQLQHMQTALGLMNVHLHHAVSDLNGETGMRIVEAILAGERDPKKLVQLRDNQCTKTTAEELEAALEGDWRPEHLFVLKQALETYRHLLEQLAACDREVEKVLAELMPLMAEANPPQAPANPPAAAQKKTRAKKFYARKHGTGLKKDLTAELQRICGVDLTRVVGLNVLAVLIIISEIGLDMSRWRNGRAFSSWLGLCPGNKISGGRILSSRTVKVVSRVATLLRTVAPAVGRSDTWLGMFHRRMRARLGPAGANTATAHKLACVIYHLLKYREDYIDVDQLVYETKLRAFRMKKLQKQAEELGFQLVKKQQPA